MSKAGSLALLLLKFISRMLFPSAFLLCQFMIAGCGFTVHPPSRPDDPAPVFLLDHGRHSSLVLPMSTDKMVRYSYGDWDWYALRQTGLAQGSRTLFSPSPAALGRKKLRISPSEEEVRLSVPVAIENVFLISAEYQNVTRLRNKLEKIFEENQHTLLHNPAFDLDFVRHPAPYTLNNNSNTMVAKWLRELGADVLGNGPFSRWKIKENP